MTLFTPQQSEKTLAGLATIFHTSSTDAFNSILIPFLCGLLTHYQLMEIS